MTKRVVSFDVRAAIPAAWDFLWKDNLARRRENVAQYKRTGVEPYRAGDTYYLTATDVENQVRRFVREAVDGVPQGSTGRACGRECGIKVRGDLQAAVRNFLLRGAAHIVGHNFGRGHVSGMRFRPAGEPLGPAEEETIARNAERRVNPRPRPRHYSQGGFGGRALCVVEAQKKRGQSCGFRQPKTWSTKNKSEVTCAKCKNLLAEREPL